jgi:N-glycosylase/DNA lyase
VKLDAVPFNLDATLCCGQVFRWNKKGDWWYGVAAGITFRIRQKNAELEFVNAGEKFVTHYFSLDEDFQRITNSINKDAHINKAIKEFWGLRIVRQEPWECLVSYICATYKSIAAIKQMLLRLSQKFGERIALDGCDFYTFPTPEKLAKTTESSLTACGLGYRAKYVLETSKKIVESGFDLESLRKMSYRQAKKALCSFSGVGSKVADCVLLFSLGKLDAFPVDVWVKRAILNHYADQFPKEFIQKISCNRSFSKAEYERLNEFGRNYFGEYAGYAQEYLYHYARMHQ